MHWLLYPIEHYPGDLWSDWQGLAVRHHAANPMLDAKFVKRLVKYFCDMARMHVLVGKQDGGTEVLTLVEPTGLGRWSIFRPAQAQLALLVCSPSLSFDLANMLVAFPRLCIRLDAFALDPREHAPFFSDSLVAERASGARNICIDVTGGFDSFWENRSRNLKKNIRRYRNRLNDELGDLRMLVARTPTDVSSATDRYGILESKGWKAQIGTAVHPGNIQGAFYRSLMVEMAADSRAYAFELYAGDLLLASRLCVSSDEMLVILKTTFDEQLKRYAAGRILLHDVLQYVFENKLARVVDFYTNATDDQMEWATSSRSMSHASIYRSVTMRLIFRGLRSTKGLLQRVVPGQA